MLRVDSLDFTLVPFLFCYILFVHGYPMSSRRSSHYHSLYSAALGRKIEASQSFILAGSNVLLVTGRLLYCLYSSLSTNLAWLCGMSHVYELDLEFFNTEDGESFRTTHGPPTSHNTIVSISTSICICCYSDL